MIAKLIIERKLQPKLAYFILLVLTFLLIFSSSNRILTAKIWPNFTASTKLPKNTVPTNAPISNLIDQTGVVTSEKNRINTATVIAKYLLAHPHAFTISRDSNTDASLSTAWKQVLHRLIVAFQQRDYKKINRILLSALIKYPDFYNRGLRYLMDDESATNPNKILQAYVKNRVNTTPFMSTTSNILPEVANQLTVSFSTSTGIGEHTIFPVILLLSTIVFGLIYTRDNKLMRATFNQLSPIKRFEGGFLKAIWPLIFINLAIILAIICSTQLIAMYTNLPIGDLMTPLWTFDNILATPLAEFIRWFTYLNLWLIVIAGATCLLSQIVKEPIVVMSLTAIFTLMHQLSLLALIPEPMRSFIPANYTQLQSMATGVSSYKIHDIKFMTVLFVLWSFSLFLLAARIQSPVFNQLKYKKHKASTIAKHTTD